MQSCSANRAAGGLESTSRRFGKCEAFSWDAERRYPQERPTIRHKCTNTEHGDFELIKHYTQLGKDQYLKSIYLERRM